MHATARRVLLTTLCVIPVLGAVLALGGRNAFSSTGTAVGRDLAGTVLFSAPVSSTATRA